MFHCLDFVCPYRTFVQEIANGKMLWQAQRAQQKALLRMCGVTSVVLTLCWFPNRTIYILSPFGIIKIGSALHRTGGIFAMFNSCVNSLIYWVTNTEYRGELFELFKFVNIKRKARKSISLSIRCIL